MQTGRTAYAVGDQGYPDILTVYLRCPFCTVLTVPLGLAYTPGEAGGIDPEHPVVATCAVCGSTHSASPAAIQRREAERACACCGLRVPAPCGADEVICPGCRLPQPGPAVLGDARRAAAVERARAAHTSVMRARLRASVGLPAEEDGERPSYLDDPLMEAARAAHQLMLHPDPRVRIGAVRPALFGVCACQEWVTPSWDVPATVLEAYDEHMAEVQTSIYAAQSA